MSHYLTQKMMVALQMNYKYIGKLGWWIVCAVFMTEDSCKAAH